MNTTRKSIALLLTGVMAATGCKKSDTTSSQKSTVAPINTNQIPTGPGQLGSPTAGGTVIRAVLNTPRAGHTATLLGNGDVLVAGGDKGGAATDCIEIYHAGAWAPAASKLASARLNHTATMLPSGRVLIAGGQSDPNGTALLKSTEIFDPATGQISAGPDMTTVRSGHIAVAYRDARGDHILIAGGATLLNGQRASTSSAELFDVATSRFLPIASMREDRVGARAVALTNGKILIQGGLTGVSSGSIQVKAAGIEAFDPVTGQFGPIGSLAADRFGSSLTLADTGQALVLGGQSAAQIEASGEAFEPLSATWSPIAKPMGLPREGQSATAIAGGDIVVAAGAYTGGPTNTVEVLRHGARGPIDGTFATLAPLVEARRDHTATKLATGRILFIGGYDFQGRPVTSSEEYDAGAALGTTPAISVPGVGQPAQPSGPPMVLALLPAKGLPGSLITIAGNNFSAKKSDNVVTFTGGVVGKVYFDMKLANLPLLGLVQTLVVEVPQGAQTGPVTVSVAGMASNPSMFTLDIAGAPVPEVLLAFPKKGKPGSIVTLFGHNFANPATANVVKISGVPANTMGGITTQSLPFLGNVSAMVVTVPSGAVTGALTVEAYGKASKPLAFEVEGTQASTTGTTTGTTSGGTTPAGSQAIYSESFDGASVTVKTTDSTVWQLSRQPAGAGAPASGARCATTGDGASAYPAGKTAYMILPEVDLTNAQSPVLQFKHWYRFAQNDGGYVIASPDAGQSWYLIRPRGDYPSQNVAALAGKPGYTGQSAAGWQPAVFDLAAFQGKKVEIAFRFSSDAASAGNLGWEIDDVSIGAAGASTTTTTTTTTSTSSSMNVLYKETLENGTNLKRSGAAIWSLGVPTAGPGAAAAGAKCVGTGLTANCPVGQDGYLITSEVDLSNVAIAQLKFKHWLSASGASAGRVLLTPDGGQTFYLLRPKGGYPASNLTAFNPGEGYTGSTNGWVDQTFDLTSFRGRKVTIVFEYKSDATTPSAGWYLDEIEVDGI